MSRKGIGSLFGRGNYEYTRLGEVQNAKTSNVYVFGEDDLAEDDVVEFEMSNVRSRKDRRNQLTENDDETPEYVERRLTEDDTLQSVALQYQCPVSEIKRVNNLIRDQDFYALTSVKIPVKKHSFLIDKIQNDDKSITESQSTLRVRTSSLSNGAACVDSGDDHSLHYDSDPTDLSDLETQRSVIRKISIRGTKGQSREARQFLREMDKDLSNFMKSSAPDRNSLDEVISVLTHKSVNPLITPDLPKQQEYCSVKWKTAIVMLLCVAVVVPVAYIIYYVYVSHDFKRHTNG